MSKTDKTNKAESKAEDVKDDVKKEADIVDETILEEESSETQEEKEVPVEDEALNTKYMRLAADFQNYKRRVEKEKSDIYAFANEKIVVELLDVIDNFERALEHAPDGSESYADGMSKIFKQFTGVLEKSGVKEIPAQGEDFDPNFHHAVMTENSEEHESGKITEVLQKGYTLKEKVIRPAMVKVAE